MPDVKLGINLFALLWTANQCVLANNVWLCVLLYAKSVEASQELTSNIHSQELDYFAGLTSTHVQTLTAIVK